jgi:hypothetical protein
VSEGEKKTAIALVKYFLQIENAGLSDFLAVILKKNNPWKKS